MTGKLFELIFGTEEELQMSLSERFSMLKTVLEPTHSKFGFALDDETTSSSSIEECKEMKMSTDTFTKRVRK